MPPFRDYPPRFGQAGEQMFAEAPVAQAAVEVLDKTVLHGLAWCDVTSAHRTFLLPAQDRVRGKLRAVVAARLAGGSQSGRGSGKRVTPAGTETRANGLSVLDATNSLTTMRSRRFNSGCGLQEVVYTSVSVLNCQPDWLDSDRTSDFRLYISTGQPARRRAQRASGGGNVGCGRLRPPYRAMSERRCR